MSVISVERWHRFDLLIWVFFFLLFRFHTYKVVISVNLVYRTIFDMSALVYMYFELSNLHLAQIEIYCLSKYVINFYLKHKMAVCLRAEIQKIKLSGFYAF